MGAMVGNNFCKCILKMKTGEGDGSRERKEEKREKKYRSRPIARILPSQEASALP